MRNTLLPLAPANLHSVTLTRGNSGVEKAVLSAISIRGMGEPQRTREFQAVGFEGSHHGSANSFFQRHLSGVSGLPSLNWPTVHYPTSQSDESQSLE